MASRLVIVVEVRLFVFESGEVLVATRPRLAGAKWTVDQAFEIELGDEIPPARE